MLQASSGPILLSHPPRIAGELAICFCPVPLLVGWLVGLGSQL